MNKKILGAAVAIAAAIGIGAIVLTSMNNMENGLIEPGPEINGVDPAGTPISPELQPSDPQIGEQEMMPDDQATISVIPDSGSTGAQITVEGTGFASNDAIAVFFDKQLVATEPELVIANTNGEFSATILVPQVESGVYEVEAFGQEAVARTNFTVN